MQRFDIAIVGAGIAGTSLAWQLAPRHRVVLIEREAQPGMHSTGRSAAMFMTSYGPPQARALTRASRRFYEAPPDGFSALPVLAPRGVCYVAQPGQTSQLEATLAELRAADDSVHRIDRGEALARVPVLQPACLGAAIFEPAAKDIDVNTLHQAYLRGARRHDLQVLTNAPLRAATRHADIWTLELDGQRLQAGLLVDAAGAWADEVAAASGAGPLGLQPCRRSAFTFAAPAGVDARGWPAVVAIDETWYFKPDAGQLLGSPANADPVPAHDVQPEELDIATGIARIEAATTLAIRRPTRTWAGLRTFASDGELVIGFDGACEGFFWLAGQGGYGIQSAQGAALLAASLIEGRALPEALAAEGLEAAAMAPARLRNGGSIKSRS